MDTADELGAPVLVTCSGRALRPSIFLSDSRSVTIAKDKERLDTLLVSGGLVSSRRRARALIMAGKVLVDGVPATKPGREFPRGATLEIKEDLPYVSRGGLKLEAALDGFEIDPSGLRVLDAGASTGGFTDCLLQRGALEVIAVDVGYGQFDWRLRNDPRVRVLERTNIRVIPRESIPGLPVDAAVADLSFISLRLILERLYDFIAPGGWALPLVKPQFEVGKAYVGKGGVVRDEARIAEALDEVETYSRRIGFSVEGRIESPVKGPKGNREFFLHLIRRT